MRNRRHQNRAQLVLELERPNPDPPVARGTKGLVETLADLLPEAMRDSEVLEETGGVDEPQNHA